jgi:hypothetical protein
MTCSTAAQIRTNLAEFVFGDAPNANVRFGSIASIWPSADDFRSSHGSGHRHGRLACLKSATSGYQPARPAKSSVAQSAHDGARRTPAASCEERSPCKPGSRFPHPADPSSADSVGSSTRLSFFLYTQVSVAVQSSDEASAGTAIAPAGRQVKSFVGAPK